MPRAALRILIVEDQFLVAKQLEWIVEEAGHTVVGSAATRDEACSLAAAEPIDLAFVDLSLADGSSGLEVASFLAEHSEARVVFATANRRRLPDDYCGAIGVVEKPFTQSGMLSALTYVAARIREPAEPVSKPESLQLSPSYRRRWQPAGAS